jgi:formyl-CoA transferase
LVIQLSFPDSPAVVKRSPLLGEHTDEILKEFCKMSDDEIKAVREAGAV